MHQEHIRSYIEVVTEMLRQGLAQPTLLTEDLGAATVEQPQADPQLLDGLRDTIFKLRSYQDPDIGEYSAGVEAGMSRAADMLENLINRLEANDGQ
jgi:hypothetical protein